MPVITQNPNDDAGLVKASPIADPPQPVNSVAIASPRAQTVTVDTRWINRADLLTYVAGSIWVVDYYSQVLNTDSQLSGNQLSVDSPYQQYKLIKGLQLRVTNPLQTAQTDESKGMELTGVSILPPLLIPNEGDMFTADLGEGVTGLFRVNLTTKKSIYKEACYEIEYAIDTDAEDKRANLDAKTIQTVYYHKDFLTIGRDPLIVPERHDALLRLSEVYETLTDQYFTRFFSREFATLLVPDQAATTYDPYLVDYLLQQFDTGDSDKIRHIRQLAMGSDKTRDAYSLWDAISLRDPSYLINAFKQVGTVSTGIFYSFPLVNTIRYSGIARSVYPQEARFQPTRYEPDSTPITVPLDTASVVATYPMAEDENIAEATPGGGSFQSAMVGGYYVLSQKFYDKAVGMNTLEGVLWNYLDRKPMDAVSLLATVRNWQSWAPLDQFYYVPIFMALIRSVLRGEE